MKRRAQIRISWSVALVFVGGLLTYAWSPLPVKDDQRVFMPGTQPGAVTLESATRCDNCHGGYNRAIEPSHNWRGSMMAHAARDPLWLACLTAALQDSIWALGNPNAGDVCIRCHAPGGWLEGRSDPPNASRVTGRDFESISCDLCHRMVDAFNALRQPDVSPDTNAVAITEANRTYQRDYDILRQLSLFTGGPFFNTAARLPVHFGDGALPNYIEATSGQYVIDPSNAKSGPRFDPVARHAWFYSRFHKSKYLCATCHDVSNPALANVLLDAGVSERQAAATYFHVERTWSEFELSAYAQPGGAPVNPKIQLPPGMRASKCQDCHMRDVTGKSCNKADAPTRMDLALHDLTGGNTWVAGILASVDQTGPAYDPYNYAILSGAKYPAARIDVTGLQGMGQALLDGRNRALQQLQMAADLIVVSDATGEVILRIQNNTGHKLISGFPEGRRMWLNVKFYDASGVLLDEINPYIPLVITRDAAGNAVYVSGGTLIKTRDDLVYEAEMSSELTGETKTFHFVLATNRHKDNRIPPKGFNIAAANSRLTTPRWGGADAPNYFTAAEYAGGYDEVRLTKPVGTVRWTAALYYQTTSKEYVEFLRDEILGVASTLLSPTPSGESRAYIVQTDPFFTPLRDWGRAIWDLWLHNGGSAPVLMTSIGSVPPCDPPGVPQNLVANAGKRRVTLRWTAVSEAAGYNIYYYQGGKYTWRARTSGTSFTDANLRPGQIYCYAVTAFPNCSDGTVESAYSNTACAIPTR